MEFLVAWGHLHGSCWNGIRLHLPSPLTSKQCHLGPVADSQSQTNCPAMLWTTRTSPTCSQNSFVHIGVWLVHLEGTVYLEWLRTSFIWGSDMTMLQQIALVEWKWYLIDLWKKERTSFQPQAGRGWVLLPKRCGLLHRDIGIHSWTLHIRLLSLRLVLCS